MNRPIGRLLLDAAFQPYGCVLPTMLKLLVWNNVLIWISWLSIMETNGTLNRKKPIRRAATILAEQLDAFVDLRDVSVPEEEEPTRVRSDPAASC